MRRRGEIWLADLAPRYGTEPGKTRPVLVVQCQALLDVDHPSTLVIPLTTNLVDEAAPLRVRVEPLEGLPKESDLIIDQIRAIDNLRLVKGPLSMLPTEAMAVVDDAIEAVLDLCHPAGPARQTAE